MNEGFFSSSIIKTFNKPKLPPRLLVEMPPAVGVVAKTNAFAVPKTPQMIMDIECYINYFLIKFLRVTDGEMFVYELCAGSTLKYESIENILATYEIITFNGNNYDIPILKYALSGATNWELKTATNALIKSNLAVWQFEKTNKLPKLKLKHIDLIELFPGILSLKIYGGRFGCIKMQDLPFPEDTVLTEEQMDYVCEYCSNDLELTKLIFFGIHPQIELRRLMSAQYKMDLMSKSDAQIAEAVIKDAIFKLTKVEPKSVPIKTGQFFYQIPDFIQFTSPALNEALDIVLSNPFEIPANGRPTIPKALAKLKVKIGSTVYKMSMGGLHSQEKSAYHVADDKFTLHDWDATSFYPEIIMRLRLYPKQLGTPFLDIFGGMKEERVAAKHAKEDKKALVLKIVINGAYGKQGSPYSIIYAPENMVQVTVTGQLLLLMLIEMLESKGISVVSGNTDGIVMKCPTGKDAMMRYIIKRWETQTGFSMEETKYVGTYARDVNNYIAIKLDGSVKLVGCFKRAGVDKNPENEICSMAMVNYIKYGTPLMTTIKACFDITKFVTIRSVDGGAAKNGVYLGKAIRWYHAKGETGFIEYCTNGKKVAMTEGTKPMMDISVGFPTDIDYDWYETNCHNLFGKQEN